MPGTATLLGAGLEELNAELDGRVFLNVSGAELDDGARKEFKAAEDAGHKQGVLGCGRPSASQLRRSGKARHTQTRIREPFQHISRIRDQSSMLV
jgi:hypothetical protein